MAMTDTAPLPKQELLIKLLKMTTSPNDGEALTAMRKANDLVSTAGWDWERLINAKITIVEDPFKNLGAGAAWGSPQASPTPPQAPARPAPPRAPTPPPPPPKPPFQAGPTQAVGNMPNRFPGHCYCCGVDQPAMAGFAFIPSKLTDGAPNNWHVVCKTCNTTGLVSRWAAPKVKKPRGKSITDLA
jgi:hypothetical protein